MPSKPLFTTFGRLQGVSMVVSDFFIDEERNGLFFKQVDADGIQIGEIETGNQIYIYLSELPEVMSLLAKIYNHSNTDK